MRTFHHLDEIIDHLGRLAETQSSEHHAFTELDHGLQTAALLRESHHDDLELQIAGLVHDIAHPWDDRGRPHHAALGAAAVRPVLGDRVALLIEGHVAAKRYLVATVPEYVGCLTRESLRTLEGQGGPMTEQEVLAFEAEPEHLAIVALRAADDSAKVPSARVAGLEFWVPVLRSVARVSH